MDYKKDILLSKYIPLQEHWTSGNTLRLSFRESDYSFKNHIGHLHEIYTANGGSFSTEQKEDTLFQRTVLSALYGTDGIMRKKDELEEAKKREEKWNSRLKGDSRPRSAPSTSKYKKVHELNSQLQSFQSTEDTQKVSNIARVNNFKNGEMPELRNSDNQLNMSKIRKDIKERTKRFNLTAADQTTLGLYQLDSKQKEIYLNFVNMLSNFDEFDKANILHDAANDASDISSLFQNYGQ